MITWGVLKAELATTGFLKEVNKEIQQDFDVLNAIVTPKKRTHLHKGDTWKIARIDELEPVVVPSNEVLDTPEDDYTRDSTTGTVNLYSNSVSLTELAQTFTELGDLKAEVKERLAYQVRRTWAGLILMELLKSTKVFCSPATQTTITMDYDGTLTASATGTGFTDLHFRKLVDVARRLGMPEPISALGYPGAFSQIWEPVRSGALSSGMSKLIPNREIRKYYGVEFHEIGTAQTPSDFPSDTAYTTPVAGRTAYSAATRQKYLGNYTSAPTDFTEFVLIGGKDAFEFTTAQPLRIIPSSSDDLLRWTCYWNWVGGVNGTWDESHTAEADAVGRVRTILVSSVDTMSY